MKVTFEEAALGVPCLLHSIESDLWKFLHQNASTQEIGVSQVLQKNWIHSLIEFSLCLFDFTLSIVYGLIQHEAKEKEMEQASKKKVGFEFVEAQ
jgi:hypothetical protein